jgi:DNA-binding CsgD family transcriptional regulator
MRKMKQKVTRKRITHQAAEDIRRLVAEGVVLREIAARYGISIPYASLIARGLRKKRRPANVAA